MGMVTQLFAIHVLLPVYMKGIVDLIVREERCTDSYEELRPPVTLHGCTLVWPRLPPVMKQWRLYCCKNIYTNSTRHRTFKEVEYCIASPYLLKVVQSTFASETKKNDAEYIIINEQYIKYKPENYIRKL